MTAKAEYIAQGGAHGALLSLIEREVQFGGNCGVNIVSGMVDCRGNDIVLTGLDAEDCFQGSGCTEEVSGH